MSDHSHRFIETENEVCGYVCRSQSAISNTKFIMLEVLWFIFIAVYYILSCLKKQSIFAYSATCLIFEWIIFSSSTQTPIFCVQESQKASCFHHTTHFGVSELFFLTCVAHSWSCTSRVDCSFVSRCWIFVRRCFTASAEGLIGNHLFDILLVTYTSLFASTSLFTEIDATLSSHFQNTYNELWLITQILCQAEE